jgi:hypothetical protein
MLAYACATVRLPDRILGYGLYNVDTGNPSLHEKLSLFITVFLAIVPLWLFTYEQNT